MFGGKRARGSYWLRFMPNFTQTIVRKIDLQFNVGKNLVVLWVVTNV